MHSVTPLDKNPPAERLGAWTHHMPFVPQKLNAIPSEDLGQRSRPTRGGTVRRHNRLQIEITYYPDSQLFISVFSASGQFVADKLILLVTTKPLRRRPDLTYSCASRCRATYIRIKVLLHCPVCLSRSELSMQHMFWMGAHKMLRTLKCSSVSEK